MSTEIWKKVPGFYGLYEVSNMGRLRSWVKRPGMRSLEPKIIKPGSSGRALQAHFWDRRHSIYRTPTLSRLVATLFIRKPRKRELIWFNDRNSMNCAASNMDFVDTNDRMALSIMLGERKRPRGAALNAENVMRAVRLRDKGVSLRETAKATGIHFTTISHLTNGHLWGHVTGRKAA